jgi:D-sedoheptulose 7-phosphate isomerase
MLGAGRSQAAAIHGNGVRDGDNMRNDMVAEHFRRSSETLSRAAEDATFQAAILAIAATITDAFRAGNKLLIAGNGGSAGDAQHIAGEFLSRLNFDRNPLPAIALTTDTSVLTAIGNDYGFDKAFERQVRGLGKPGDVFIAISTSGRSPNVVAALKAAREAGLVTIGFTGTAANSAMAPLCDHCLAAPSPETPLIQQIHIVAAHAICGLVERNIFGGA